MQENPQLTLSCRWGLLRAKLFGVCHSSNFHSLLLQIQWKLCLKTMPSAEGEWEETLEWPSSSARLIGNCVKDVMSGQQQPTCPSVYNPPFFVGRTRQSVYFVIIALFVVTIPFCLELQSQTRFASCDKPVFSQRSVLVYTAWGFVCLRACVCNCLFSPDLFFIIIN